MTRDDMKLQPEYVLPRLADPQTRSDVINWAIQNVSMINKVYSAYGPMFGDQWKELALVATILEIEQMSKQIIDLMKNSPVPFRFEVPPTQTEAMFINRQAMSQPFESDTMNHGHIDPPLPPDRPEYFKCLPTGGLFAIFNDQVFYNESSNGQGAWSRSPNSPQIIREANSSGKVIAIQFMKRPKPVLGETE